MLATSPHRVDQDAKALKERFELACVRDDDAAIANAARALFWFCADHPEYKVCQMIPEAVPHAPEAARRIASKYAGRCAQCDASIQPGEEIWWTPGERGIACLRCGGKKR